MRTNVKRNILVFVTLLTLLVATLAGFFITRQKSAYALTDSQIKSVSSDFEFTVIDSSDDSFYRLYFPTSFSSSGDRQTADVGAVGCTFRSIYKNFNAYLTEVTGKQLTKNWSFEFLHTLTNDDSKKVPVIKYHFSYLYTSDTFSSVIWINYAYCDFFRHMNSSTITTSDLEEYLEGDLETAADILFNMYSFSWDMQDPEKVSAPVTFVYKTDPDTSFEYTEFFLVGETPDLSDAIWQSKYHKIAFDHWEPAIVPVTSASPVTYTAVYVNPTVSVKNNDGTVTEETLTYGYIDEELLLRNFTNEFKDIGSMQPLSVGECAFTNREDFWFMQRSDSSTVHTIDTNLTLEAISFQFRKKGTDVYLSFKNAKELHGSAEVSINWLSYRYDKAWQPNNDLPWYLKLPTAMVSGVLKWVAPVDDEKLREDFIEKYYPDAVLQAPDEYDLVYVYYYSMDLAESGDKATFEYKDNYKQSVLKVKNNLDDTVTEYPFSYDKDRGCYFVLPMDLYWQSMNKVSSAHAVSLGGDAAVVAEVSDARFSVSGFDGSVEYDKDQANNLKKALTSVVYLYTDKLTPDYNDEYTVTIEFTDYTIVHDDNTDNIGTVIDKFGNNVSNWWNGLKDKLGGAWKWVKIVFWIVVGIIAAVLVIRLVTFIISLVAPRRRR